MKKTLILLLIISMSANYAFSKSFRVSQIPNGNLNRCANCHVNPGGGGTLTPFGQEVANNFLEGGNVVWNADLAAIDSDGDGFSNGEELQDPDGSWTSGSAAPGNPDLVANPGDASSVPNTTAVEEFALKTGLTILSVSPNPSVEMAVLNISLRNAASVQIELINSAGMTVSNISNSNLVSGFHSLPIDIASKSAGVYFVKISLNNYSHFEKIIKN